MKIILEKWICLSESKYSGDPAFKQTTAKMAIHDGKHGYICLKYHGGKITYHFDSNANGREFIFIYHFTQRRRDAKKFLFDFCDLASWRDKDSTRTYTLKHR